MRNRADEARRWYQEAESDLAFARIGRREEFFSKACFLCQQAGEKALKALAYGDGERFVVGHSLQEILDLVQPKHPALKRFRDICRLLDQYYIATRYPDALPGGTPHRSYTESQAAEAIAGAEGLLGAIREEFGGMNIPVE